MSDGNGGDLLVRLMRAQGVDVAFGVVSVHNLPLVEAVDRELRFVPVRHEAAAVNAADAYARATGGLGVAITSTGTGAGNAAGALVEAQTASSRVLHVTGQIEVGYLDSGRGVIHETKDQIGMLRAVSKHAATIRSSDESMKTLRTAVGTALSLPYGPSSVEWPIDLQYAGHDIPTGEIDCSPSEPPEPEPAQLDAAARSLLAARRPVIWAGGGATDAGESVRLLAEHCGAGIVTSNSGRGTVAEDHELVIGNFATKPETRELLSAADLILAVGTHFRSNETAHYSLDLPDTVIQLDVEPAAIGRVYPASVSVVGDARESLCGIASRMTGSPAATEPGWRDRVVKARSRVRTELGTAIGVYRQVCDSLRSHLPRRSVMARDVTIPSSMWGNRLLEIYDPASNVFPVGGGIGQGLAMGLGASIARHDEPTVVIAGDGGISVHLGELAAVAGERPWLVVVLFNDGGYGVLRNMQDHHTGRRSGVDLYTPDFARLISATDIPHELVRAPEQFDDVLSKAIAEHGPYVIEIDVTAFESMPEPFVPPVAVPQQ